MKIAICDDEKGFHIEIEELMRLYSIKRKTDIFIDHYINGASLISSTHKYEVIFMDYQMDDLNGIETARKIRETNSDSIIIFISAYPSAALDAFEVNTFRFIKKPVDKAKLFKALDDYVCSIDRSLLLQINTNDCSYNIKTSDIIYLEADAQITAVRTKDTTIYVHRNIKKLEDELPKTDFIRCHKSYVVGFSYIKNHNRTEIMFENGEKAYIGRHYAEQFRTALQNYIIRYNKEHQLL